MSLVFVSDSSNKNVNIESLLVNISILSELWLLFDTQSAVMSWWEAEQRSVWEWFAPALSRTCELPGCCGVTWICQTLLPALFCCCCTNSQAGARCSSWDKTLPEFGRFCQPEKTQKRTEVRWNIHDLPQESETVRWWWAERSAESRTSTVWIVSGRTVRLTEYSLKNLLFSARALRSVEFSANSGRPETKDLTHGKSFTGGQWLICCIWSCLDRIGFLFVSILYI